MNDTWGTVILAGGRGRRMGYEDKSSLTYQGQTFLDRIGEQLLALGRPCRLSRAVCKGGDPEGRYTLIEDTVQGENGEWIGPMGGIWSCFERTLEDWLFFVSCDMPMFRNVMAARLLAYRKPGIDAVLWRTRDGRIQPMCALYSRNCVDALKQCMDMRNYRMMAFLDRLNCMVVDTSAEHIPDSWFLNVNTPEIYKRLKESRQPVLSVSGRKNTGKTWLLERLVKQLAMSGIRTAVIKHDGHEFEADVPGTDSYRMKKAGALGTVVYSGSRFSLVKDQAGLEAEDFFEHFPEADVILLEGQKYSRYPKIEVLRQAVSRLPVCSPETVLAYVADFAPDEAPDKAAERLLNMAGAPGRPGIWPAIAIPFDHKDEIMERVIEYMDRTAMNPLS